MEAAAGSALCKVETAEAAGEEEAKKRLLSLSEPTASFKAHETWVCQLARDNLPAKPLQLTVKQNINSKLKWLARISNNDHWMVLHATMGHTD